MGHRVPRSPIPPWEIGRREGALRQSSLPYALVNLDVAPPRCCRHVCRQVLRMNWVPHLPNLLLQRTAAPPAECER